MGSIDSLLDKYAKYIIEDKIPNGYNIDSDVVGISNNINKYGLFLDEYKEYNNNTWLYFKGLYYFYNKEYKKMLLLLNDINDSNIFNLFAYYYEYIEHNDDLIKKYYLMAIELKNSYAMNNLGNYYYLKEKNYDLMKKYYLMAINLNNVYSMNNLGHYFQYIEKDYDLMKKYYIMAIELNYTNDIFKGYCREIENDESNYYKYVYYPRILQLIIYIKRLNKINKNKYKDYINIFLPEEILIYIFNQYIIN